MGGGFEPPKASPTDLQSVPFDRSGTPPNAIIDHGGLRSADGVKLNPKSDSPGPTLSNYMKNGKQIPLQAIRAVDVAEGPKSKFYHGASGGTRTHGLLITNQLLYQLSYAGCTT